MERKTESNYKQQAGIQCSALVDKVQIEDHRNLQSGQVILGYGYSCDKGQELGFVDGFKQAAAQFGQPLPQLALISTQSMKLATLELMKEQKDISEAIAEQW